MGCNARKTNKLKVMNWRANWSLADIPYDIPCNNALQCHISVSAHTYTSHPQPEPQVSSLSRMLNAIYSDCNPSVWQKPGESGDYINRLYGCIKHGGSVNERSDCGLVSYYYCFVFPLLANYLPEIRVLAGKILTNRFLLITHISPSFFKVSVAS
jgi:hypothetical protein